LALAPHLPIPDETYTGQLIPHSIPHLAQLKNACHPQISSYTACLDSNASQADEVVKERCGALMKELWECSDRAMKVIEGAKGA
jgi:hypothetical protein